MEAKAREVMGKLHLAGGSEAKVQEPTAGELLVLRSNFSSVGQDQVFKFWEKLTAAEKREYYDQLTTFDTARVQVCGFLFGFSLLF
jgi:hypothetical protein